MSDKITFRKLNSSGCLNRYAVDLDGSFIGTVEARNFIGNSYGEHLRRWIIGTDSNKSQRFKTRHEAAAALVDAHKRGGA